MLQERLTVTTQHRLMKIPAFLAGILQPLAGKLPDNLSNYTAHNHDGPMCNKMHCISNYNLGHQDHQLRMQQSCMFVLSALTAVAKPHLAHHLSI